LFARYSRTISFTARTTANVRANSALEHSRSRQCESGISHAARQAHRRTDIRNWRRRVADEYDVILMSARRHSVYWGVGCWAMWVTVRQRNASDTLFLALQSAVGWSFAHKPWSIIGSVIIKIILVPCDSAIHPILHKIRVVSVAGFHACRKEGAIQCSIQGSRLLHCRRLA